VVTGVDDQSRFCVLAAVVARPTGRAVCAAFAAALVEFGVPDEVLTDNGKHFTARFGRPHGGEVLFDRICPSARGRKAPAGETAVGTAWTSSTILGTSSAKPGCHWSSARAGAGACGRIYGGRRDLVGATPASEGRMPS